MSEYTVADVYGHSETVHASCPLDAAFQASPDGEADCPLTIKNTETGTICLVDFDLVKTWKDIS